jgi:hypothetical protein
MAEGWKGTTMMARTIGTCLVFVHGTTTPTDAEWDRVLQMFRDVGPARSKTFVWTDGAAPNAAQRAKLAKVTEGAAPPIAVLTDSAFVRAACTAISWFNPRIRAFSPTDMDRALDHLDATASDRPALKQAMDEMRAELRAPTAKRA